MNFKEIGVDDTIIKKLNSAGITTPTPIQEKTIPLLLAGKDVIGGAKTGTGKTFAYSIPMAGSINKSSKMVEGLILCPTRELSIQVKLELDKIFDNIRCEAIYGGESYEIQLRKLKAKPNVIVGTPGRIIDQMNKGNLCFSNVKYLVLDEADEMLKMGFSEDLDTIMAQISNEHQTALFSATIPPYIKSLSKKYMNNPELIQVKEETLTVDKIDEQVYYCMKDSKKDLLIRLLDYYSFNHVMIFCNTKSMVDELSQYLIENGYKCEGLHGDLKQAMRDRVMQKFKSGVVDILIATDVAARGIDIDDIDCVFNFDIPNENELYVHRIGRTARAGRSGTSITLSTTRGKSRIEELEKFTKSKIEEHKIPTVDDIRNNSNRKFYHEIINLIEMNKDRTNYDNLIKSLSKSSTDPIPLIRGLLAGLFDGRLKEYNEILTSRPKEKKVKSLGSKFVTIHLNVGSVDRIKANQLVMIFHDEFGIYRENFGKITIDKKNTRIEIKSDSLRRIDKKSIKINNRRANIRIL
ncbi:MAG: DEAD/DEAH box helicase [Acholeplasmatales bacterium]|nr:DEAD/DEAH box helicase [Acholeplasmatales bacterium]